MTSLTDGSAVLYWSESTPIASAAGLGRRLEDAATGTTSSVVDDVRAVLVHALGGGLALGRVTEAGEVRRLGQVLDLDLDVRVDRLGAGLVAGLELLDQRDLDATHEADVAGLGLECRGRADQERALLLGEHQAGDVRDRVALEGSQLRCRR